MNILFIAPRQHTNYSGIINTLKKKNNIFFNSIYKSKIEDYTSVKPKILKQSLFSKLLVYLLGKKILKFYYFPKISDYYNYIKQIAPDLIILRITGRFNFYLNIMFLSLFNCKIICHEQKINNRRYLRNKSIKNFFLYLEFYLLKSIFKIKLFSPIYKKKDDKEFYYLPFVTHKKINKLNENKKFNFISIGKFEKRKNFFFLIKVLKRLKFDFSLLIIGENSNKNHNHYLINLKRFIKKNNFQKKIKIKTNIEFNRIEYYIKKRGLFILPSYSEPASISLLESISAGVPVICSDSCGTRIYIKENSNGFIFKTNNETSLLKKLNIYLSSKKKFKFYSKNCYEYSKNNLSSDNFNYYFKKILKSFKKI